MPGDGGVRAVGDTVGRARVPQHARRAAGLPERIAASRDCVGRRGGEGWKGRIREPQRYPGPPALPAPPAPPALYCPPMKHSALAASLLCLAAFLSSDLLAAGKQTRSRNEPDMCAPPPGAQPLLPAKLLP